MRTSSLANIKQWHNRRIPNWNPVYRSKITKTPTSPNGLVFKLVYRIIIFRLYLKYGRKIIHSTQKIRGFITLTCQKIMFDFSLMSDSDLEFFSRRNSIKFAVECDWNSKISQNVQSLFSLAISLYNAYPRILSAKNLFSTFFWAFSGEKWA